MDSLRIVADAEVLPLRPCCRCDAVGQPWDQIAGKPYCPDCEESLALGQAPPLIERTEKLPCAACGQLGTLCFLTFSLRTATPVRIDLCPVHFRALLGRRLGPAAYHQLCRQLAVLDLEAEQIFLLHGTFYDGTGRALLPVNELD